MKVDATASNLICVPGNRRFSLGPVTVTVSFGFLSTAVRSPFGPYQAAVLRPLAITGAIVLSL